MNTTSATVCVRCRLPIKDRSTYIPCADGPLHPYCWEQNASLEELIALRADNARLREALEEIDRIAIGHRRGAARIWLVCLDEPRMARSYLQYHGSRLEGFGQSKEHASTFQSEEDAKLAAYPWIGKVKGVISLETIP